MPTHQGDPDKPNLNSKPRAKRHTYRDAFRRGQTANRRKKNHNPYTDIEKRDAWFDGAGIEKTKRASNPSAV